MATPSLPPSSSHSPPTAGDPPHEPSPSSPSYTIPLTSTASLPSQPTSLPLSLPRDPRLRYVPPYWHAYSTMAKQRWYNREILELVSTEFRDRSLEYYRFALLSGVTTINGRRAKPGDIVRNGDRIQNVVHRHEPPVTGQVKVVSGEKEKGRNMVVVMKPGSVPVHAAGRYYRNSLVEILKSDFGFEKIYTVNRLDRLTSGLMLVALTPQRASELCKLFAENKVKKEYLARVAGEFPEGEVVVSEPLLIIDRQMGLVITHPLGKPSLTIFRRLSYSPSTNTSVVLALPKTGRTHQIRVHAQWLGYPIANDPIYRADNVWGEGGGKGGIDLGLGGGEGGKQEGAEKGEGQGEDGGGASVMPEEAARALGLTGEEARGRVDGLSQDLPAVLGAGDGLPLGEGLPLTPAGEVGASDVDPPPAPNGLPAPTPRRRLPRETGADIGLSSPVPLSSQARGIIKSLRDAKDKDEDWARWRDVVFRARDAGAFLRGEEGAESTALGAGEARGGGRGSGRVESASGPEVARKGHYALQVPASVVSSSGPSASSNPAERPSSLSQSPPQPSDTQNPANLAHPENLDNPERQKKEKEEEEPPFRPMLDLATNTLYCPTCYAPLHPDPKPEKMYIFLHAWRYTLEGEEGGEWESEWPEWAQEGWRPEGGFGRGEPRTAGDEEAPMEEGTGGAEKTPSAEGAVGSDGAPAGAATEPTQDAVEQVPAEGKPHQTDGIAPKLGERGERAAEQAAGVGAAGPVVAGIDSQPRSLSRKGTGFLIHADASRSVPSI